MELAVQMPKVEHETMLFRGGLDQVTPNLQLPPGAVRSSQNYYCDILGGYRRTEGYERFDGHSSPSNAQFYLLAVTFSASVAAGNTITGLTSGATGYVIAVTATEIIFTKLTGTFQSGEAIQVGGVTKATSTATAVGTAATALLNAQYTNLAADAYRADIAAVPGSGNILGLFYYNDVLYAFRANAGATATDLYKSTGSGWSQITMLYEVTYSAGSGSATIVDGGTLTQGGVTATIRRVLVRTGSLSGGSAAGTLVISAPSGGNFAAGAATVGAGTLTLAGIQTQIALTKDGRYETIQANFGGSVNTKRVYGCDGVNPAFEFDGTYYVPIHTGMTGDAPKHISFHLNHLFLSFGSSVQYSSLGTPFTWTPLSGAGEIAMGDTVTAMVSIQGAETAAALLITARNQTSMLYGSASANFALVPYSKDVGGIDYTVRQFSPHIFMGNFRGVTTLSATANFGNFEEDTITRPVAKFMDGRVAKITEVVLSGKRGHYRLFFNDGSALYITLNEGKIVGMMPMVLANTAYVACRGESSSGVERIFFGSSAGMVYEMDVGTSFDGANIDAYLYLTFNHSKSPRVRKRYRKLMMEVSGEGYSTFNFSYEMNYASTEMGQGNTPMPYVTSFSATQWDSFTWDSFIWDGVTLAPSEVEIVGTAENLSLMFLSSSDYYSSHKLHAAIVHWTSRRGVR